MRKGYRTQDYHFIKSQTDALYYAADIPSTAWGPTMTEDPKFKLAVFDETNVGMKEQVEWFSRMRNGELFDRPYLVLLSSDVDDSVATAHGYDLMKRALLKHRVQITESAGIKEEKTDEETVFMLTNVYDEAPAERVQSIRDWSYRHKTSFRLICGTGDPGVLLRRLKLKFNAVFYLDSKVVTEKNFA